MQQLSEALRVDVNPAIPGVDGRAEYRIDELSLTYKPETSLPEANAMRSGTMAWRQSGSKVFVTAGFVTITFHGSPFVFTSLDAYANDQRWIETIINVPAPEGRGALVLADDRADEERITLATQPTFEVDHSQKLIRIRFDSAGAEHHFAISRGLFAGLKDNRLAELILSDVRFD